MFVFDNVLDKDVSSYEYQLYKADQVTGSFPNYSLINNATIYLSGESGSNVFAISVENSSDAQNIRYYGRVRTKDTSNNYSSWSPLVLSDQDTPLIGNQFIASLTAAKITAGKIGAHEIILSQAGPQTNIAAPSNMAILRSSDYNGSYSSNTWTNGSSGWIIAGDGHAEFSSASLRGGLKAQSVYIDAHNRWRRNSSDTDSSLEFKVGSNDKYVFFDGTDITFSGNLSAAGGTFSGNLSAAGGTFTGALSGGTISIGSGNSIFKADSNGIYLGNSTFASAPFRVTPAGVLTANNATITGTINATSGTFTGTLSSANGTFTGTLVTGSVRVGNEAISSGGSEKGISIQASGLSQWNNAWVQRADNSVYFRAGNDTRFIQLDTSGANEIKFPNFSVDNDGLLTANNATITGHIVATSGTFTGTLSSANGTFTGTVSAGIVTSCTITNSDGRILLPSDGSPIHLGTFNVATNDATQCYILSGGDQGLKVETSGHGTMWISGADLKVNNNPFTSGRYIVGLLTNEGSGNTLFVSNGTVYRSSSKRELKENIQDFSDIGLIDGLRPRTFTWKAFTNRKAENNEETEEEKIRRETSVNIGFIAEEVEEASNGLLSIYNYEEGGNGEVEMYKHLDILALAVANIQDLRKRVADLENS